MEKEIKKRIDNICDEVGSESAMQAKSETVEKLLTEYHNKINSGKSEIEAYREIVSDLDEVREELDKLPKTEEEKTDRKPFKSIATLIWQISFVVWAIALSTYFYVSVKYNIWHLSWLIPVWALMGQVLLEMILRFNKGKSLSHVLKVGLTIILWMLVVSSFIAVSIITGAWHMSWLIFLFGGVFQLLIIAIV